MDGGAEQGTSNPKPRSRGAGDRGEGLCSHRQGEHVFFPLRAQHPAIWRVGRETPNRVWMRILAVSILCMVLGRPL